MSRNAHTTARPCDDCGLPCRGLRCRECFLNVRYPRRARDRSADRARRITPPAVRFWKHFQVDQESGCWVWASSRTTAGYGLLDMGLGKPPSYSHRFAYELLVGPIPDGLHLDHLCRNRPCCNPDHLEPVTPRVNVLRARRPECASGHAYTPENTWIDRNGWRRCLICHLRAQGRKNAVRRARRQAARTAS